MSSKYESIGRGTTRAILRRHASSEEQSLQSPQDETSDQLREEMNYIYAALDEIISANARARHEGRDSAVTQHMTVLARGGFAALEYARTYFMLLNDTRIDSERQKSEQVKKDRLLHQAMGLLVTVCGKERVPAEWRRDLAAFIDEHAVVKSEDFIDEHAVVKSEDADA